MGIALVALILMRIAYIEIFPRSIAIPEEVKNANVTKECLKDFGPDSELIQYIRTINRPEGWPNGFYGNYASKRLLIGSLVENTTCEVHQITAALLQSGMQLDGYKIKSEVNTVAVGGFFKDTHRFSRIYHPEELFFYLWAEGKYSVGFWMPIQGTNSKLTKKHGGSVRFYKKPFFYK